MKNKNAAVRIYTLLSKYRGLLALALIGAVISVGCNLAAPLFIGRTIDLMVGPSKVDFTAIAKLLTIMAAIFLAGCFFTWLLNFSVNRAAYKSMRDLRGLLFDKLGVLPLSFYDTRPHGDTVSRFINDVDIISDGLIQGLVALVSGVITIVGCIVFMLSINPLMTLVVVLCAPAAFFISRFITVHSQQLFKDQARLLGELNGYSEEIIEGHKTVRAFGYEKASRRRFGEINSRLYATGVRSQFISSLANPSARVVNNIAYALVGVIGGAAAINGTITVGDISSFLIFQVIFAKPFNDITSILTQLQSAAASAQRVFDVLDLPPETPDPSDAQTPEKCAGAVSFNDVNFSYVPGQNLIRNFTLKVEPGCKVAIVGHTGAGKTTLVNLLMRFYDVDSGSITLDGVDIRRMKRDDLRRSFGMVLQDTWLFEGTIRDNIAYAKPGASMGEIIAAAKNAGADDFIRRLAHGYDTVLRDAGDNLSQGQKQLLTIARVMLADPPILILDEATSSIDTSTEARIQKAFMKMTEGRTSFVIAHRLSTVKNADTIIVMDKGAIVEEGRHDELLRKNGSYAELYNSQFQGQENSAL
jgi:ATP-binding cassette subfamily B multidrug efflux pump